MFMANRIHILGRRGRTNSLNLVLCKERGDVSLLSGFYVSRIYGFIASSPGGGEQNGTLYCVSRFTFVAWLIGSHYVDFRFYSQGALSTHAKIRCMKVARYAGHVYNSKFLTSVYHQLVCFKRTTLSEFIESQPVIPVS